MSIVAKQSEPDRPIRGLGVQPVSKDAACVAALRICLSDAVVLSFMAQGFHWNVSGRDFTQLHTLFGNIYEDVYEAVDPLAENIRKIDAEAPYLLSDFQRYTTITQVATPVDASTMIRTLHEANEQATKALNSAFAIATDMNLQGIADFLAGRIDMHTKWSWMLRESM